MTVPECLEALLLAPEHAAWAQRIRYVILDEVHCISTSEEGRMWERILLLANAPFLALSATVGEPETFVAWLQSVKDHQKAMDAGAQRESYEVAMLTLLITLLSSFDVESRMCYRRDRFFPIVQVQTLAVCWF